MRPAHKVVVLVMSLCLVFVTSTAAASQTRRAQSARGERLAGTWRATAKMRTAREGAIAARLPGGKVLVAGGDNGEFARDVDNSSAYVLSAEIYDPASGTWAPTGSMTTAHSGAVSARIPGGKVLVAGGGYKHPTSAEIYDPSTGTWTSTGSMITERQGPVSARLPGGNVLVAGGIGRSGYLTSAEIYDPASGTWTPTGSMTTAREFATATRLPGGKVLVAGGFDGVGLDSAEIYNPASGTWTPTGSMTTVRQAATSAPLPGGKVLVAGGDNASFFDVSSSFLTSAEIYDPASGTWRRTASMANPREDATATVLPGGEVLLAGGFGPPNPFLASATVYDPANASWTPTGDMTAGRESATATPLPGGKVLVAGGHNHTGVLASADVFTPTSARIAIRIASRALRHHRVRVKLRCARAARCKGMIRLRARTVGRHGHQVGHRHYNVRRGRHTIHVRLGRRARRKLARRGHLRVTAIAKVRRSHRTARDTATLRRHRHQLGHIHPVTQREAERVKDKHLAELRARYHGFLGVGIGAVPGDSEPQPDEPVHILVIYLEDESNHPSSPQSIAGVPIRFVVTGPIHAL